MKKRNAMGKMVLSLALAASLAVTPAFATEVDSAAAAETTVETTVETTAETTVETTAEATAETTAETTVEEEPTVIAAAPEEEATVAGITSYTLSSGNQAYVYVPQGDGIDVGHNATWKPIILVYNSEALTAESTLELAQEGGFADIAAQEECVIMFVNPLDAEAGWTEADAASILAAVGSGNLTAAYSDGTLASYDAVTGQNDSGLFPGYTEKVYVFADGAAADFVSEYILAGQYDTVHYMTGYFKPAAAYLSNVSVNPEAIQSDNDSVEMPVYLVNAAKSVTSFYKNANSAKYTVTAKSKNKTGFDAAQVKKAWNGLVSSVRRCYDVTIDIPDYDTNYYNVNETYVTTDGTEIEYYLWIPNSVVKAKKGTVPLVMGMHGNDNSALTMAVITEWPTLAAENGFAYLGLNSVESATDDEIMEVLIAIEKKYSIIDTTRVYATGFSNGSRHTWSLAHNSKYSDYFAAIAPMNFLINDSIYQDTAEYYADTIMPTIYFGATGSHIREIPNQSWYFLNNGQPEATLAYILARNNVTDSYVNDTEAGLWGITPDSTEEYTSKYYNVADKQVVDTVSNYLSEDGSLYTKLVTVTSIHEYEDLNAQLAWDFISQFARKADGTVINIKDGLADKPAADGNWYHYKNGKVDKKYTGVEKNKNGWWYVKNGKVQFGYTGIASNKNGTWYIQKGKVNFAKSGRVKVGKKYYTVKNGRVVK